MAKKIYLIDKIYGKFVIDSPILQDLLLSKTVLRLKDINQYGVPDKYSGRKSYSRYEHSVGVMHLLQIFGATEEEQVAGLLHDVSHRAFSHVYDWIVGSGLKENTQDEIHEEYLKGSDASLILKRYGFDVKKIASLHDYKMLDNEIPNLCVDRIDYSLRQMNLKTARKIVSGLANYNNVIICKDIKTARLFGNSFLDLQIESWGGEDNIIRNHIFAHALRIALEKKIIVEKDFFKDDSFILKKIENSKDNAMLRDLKILSQKPLPTFNVKTTVSYSKFRYIDPQILRKDKLLPLSSIDSNFKKRVKMAQSENKKGIAVPKR